MYYKKDKGFNLDILDETFGIVSIYPTSGGREMRPYRM